MPMEPVKTVDEERSQSRARLGICVVSLAGFAVTVCTRDQIRPSTLLWGYTTIIAYLVFSVAWYTFVCRLPGRYPRRRYFTLLADLGIMTVFMHLGDEYVTAYYPIFLWVIIGNGIRFGPHFLRVGVVLGAAGFGSLLVGNDYWRESRALGAGLLLGVVVLPVFFLTVLRRLQAVSRLEVALARSQLADQAKGQFLAAMSHELRTPMNAVLGMAEMLQSTDLDPGQHEQVRIITRSVDALLNIINDILDYSKITAHRLTLESIPFDLRQVLTDVHLLLAPTAQEKGIDLIFEYADSTPRGFCGDPTRVRQVAFNLVGNAIKFTGEGTVRLSCTVAADRERENVLLEIRDTGVGIPEDRLESIFDVFEQGDATVTRRFGGTGLGLAISRQLARLMGGDVSVESHVGRGSTFTARLSLQPCTPPVRKAPEQARELPSFGLHALVVEDNPFNQMVTRQMLAKIGITAQVAATGADALEALELARFDLVLMDVRMPVMDGYEATRRIRARADALARIPILAVTAETTDDARERSLAAGMDAHISKPVRVKALVDAIEELTGPADRTPAQPSPPVAAESALAPLA